MQSASVTGFDSFDRYKCYRGSFLASAGIEHTARRISSLNHHEIDRGKGGGGGGWGGGVSFFVTFHHGSIILSRSLQKSQCSDDRQVHN